MTVSLDLDFVRRHFPSLASGWRFLDNAGGSQCLVGVSERVAEVLHGSMVATGASYGPSQLAAERHRTARERLAVLINAASGDEIVFGGSSTQLLQNLGLSLSKWLEPGDEIVMSRAEHHANVEPWYRLRAAGFTVHEWSIRRDDWSLHWDDLEPMLNERTRLVSFTQCSNVVGTVHPVAEIAARLRERGILVLVDGVAYAPHAAVDVQALGVDFYLVSLYKVFGPHIGMLYGRRELLLELPGINHSFLRADDIPYKFQPGNANQELAHGATAIVDYLVALGRHHGAPADVGERECLEHGFAVAGAHERGLVNYLLEGLASIPSIDVQGRSAPESPNRAGIVSFVSGRNSPRAIAELLAERRVGVRAGDFYAKALAEDLRYESAVRVSLAHYNSREDIEVLLDGLRG